MKYFTYILQCIDNTFYIGSTNDLERRIYEHNHLKSGAHYTKIRRPVKLLYTEEYETMSEARKRENMLKKKSRKQKIELLKNLK